MTVALRHTREKQVRKQTPKQAQPFLKWAGGKASLMPQLAPHFPKQFNQYFEPFIGGAAVFLHLNPSKPNLSDINPKLIQCYLAVRDECEALMERLREMRSIHSKEHFYETRERLNNDPTATLVERAAMQIYLNKTCFNGLYRENRRGHFNVPFGRYNNPRIFDDLNLLSVSARLKKATITCQPFERIVDRLQPGDFVYLDPPYDPVSKTSSFVSFTKFGFATYDQERLRDVCREIDARGAMFMQSNSDTGLINSLYSDYNVSRVSARRSINSKARGRGAVSEVVVTNYKV